MTFFFASISADRRRFLNSVTVLVKFHSSEGQRLPIGTSVSLTITLRRTVSIDTIFFETYTPSCWPTSVRPWAPRLNGAMPPKLVSSLWSVLTPARMSQRTSRLSIAATFTATSKPLFSTAPMLASGFALKPSDGGIGFARIRSVVFLLKYVTSAETRLCQNPASSPASNSVPLSGLRFALPGLPSTAPAYSVVPIRYGAAESVVSAAPGPGDRPVVPHEARRRSVLTYFENRSKNFSSPIAQLNPTFGSTNDGASVPNDEFLSIRTPSCRNRLFSQPTCSWLR